MTTRDHYATLGLPHHSCQDDIREAYRRLARELHPDLTGNDAKKAERFKRVNAAYRTLMDSNARRDHDGELEAGQSPGDKLMALAEELLGAEAGSVCDRIRRDGITLDNYEEIARAFGKAAKITHERMKDRVTRATAAREGKPNDFFSIMNELLS